MYKLQSPRPANPYVFYGTNNFVPIMRYRLTALVMNGIEASGVKLDGRTFHSFRHYFVSQMASLIGIEATSKLVGHTSTSTTEIYRSSTAEELTAQKTAVNKILQFVS